MREHRHTRNAVYMPDESYCPVRPDAIERLVSSWYAGPNISAIARHVVGTWASILDFARHIKLVKTQDVELAVLLQLLFARYEAAFFADESSRNAYVNRVLGELHRHLKESTSAEDYATCLGRITSLMTLFQEAFHRHSEMMVLVDLHTEDRPLGRELATLQSYRCRK
ncbi:hypothetical protein AAVH_21267 [Aphelenchoides avenae]|nr:hypothetical protein AAVH_21267 [Aphelenchus avenae]